MGSDLEKTTWAKKEKNGPIRACQISLVGEMTKFCRYGAFEKERLSDKVSVVASDSWITVPFQTQCSKSFIRGLGLFGNLHTIDEGQSLNFQLLLHLGNRARMGTSFNFSIFIGDKLIALLYRHLFPSSACIGDRRGSLFKFSRKLGHTHPQLPHRPKT